MRTKLFIGLMCSSMSLMSGPLFAQQWTLKSSIEQAYAESPEIKMVLLDLDSRKQEVQSAGLWPNPSVEVRVDNKLGTDDGSGGYDLTDITFSQPIPVARLQHQRALAKSMAKIAEFDISHEQLMLEHKIAKAFHDLQFAHAEYELAKTRLTVADNIYNKSQKNRQGVIVRYLTPLEKMRLDIVREEARQAETSAEGAYNEALMRFARLLNIDVAAVTDMDSLTHVKVEWTLEELLQQQSQHIRLVTQQEKLVAARDEIELVKSSLLDDPEISISRSRDSFTQGREDVYALMFNMQIPLWSRDSKELSRAKYNAGQQNIQLQKDKRELEIQLKQSYTHLNHLIEQAQHHKNKVLLPSSKMLELTSRGFISGELNMLTLLDAHNTYFSAQLRYNELLVQAWHELADMRLAAGIVLVSAENITTQQNLKGGN